MATQLTLENNEPNNESNKPNIVAIETMEKTNISPIDLQLIGNNLIIKGKEAFLKELAKTKALFVPFEKMLNKYPQLEAIKALTAFKVFCNEDNKKDIRLHTLSLMSSDSKLICVLPDFNQTQIAFDLISINLSEKSALVSIQDIPLIVNVLLSDDGLDMISNIEGDDELIIEASNVDISWLAEFKIYGNKLETVPKGKYTAKLNGLKTDSYNSPMANLTSTGGKEYKNVVTNQQLSRILKDGKAHTVVIADTVTTKSKSGQFFSKVELYED